MRLHIIVFFERSFLRVKALKARSGLFEDIFQDNGFLAFWSHRYDGCLNPSFSSIYPK